MENILCSPASHILYHVLKTRVFVLSNFIISALPSSPERKVHKHEIILNFFLPKSNPYMPLVNFRKKISLLFFRFSPEFRSSNIFAVTEHTRNLIFFEGYPKIFLFQNVHLGPIRWVPKRGFFKIWIF